MPCRLLLWPRSSVLCTLKRPYTLSDCSSLAFLLRRIRGPLQRGTPRFSGQIGPPLPTFPTPPGIPVGSPGAGAWLALGLDKQELSSDVLGAEKARRCGHLWEVLRTCPWRQRDLEAPVSPPGPHQIPNPKRLGPVTEIRGRCWRLVGPTGGVGRQ